MNATQSRLWRKLGRFGALLLLLAIMVAIFQSLEPRYLSNQNIQAILRHMSTAGLAALGLTFVIVVRQFDLSFPWIGTLGAMTMAFMIAQGEALTTCLLVGLLVGAAVGVVNGFAVGYLELPDIITTIAMGSIAFGCAFFYSGGVTIYENFFTSGIMELNDGRLVGISLPIVFMVGLYLVAALVLHGARFGRAFYATGENRQAALFSGIPVRFYVLLAFVLCSALTTWAVTLAFAAAGQADVGRGGDVLMPAYAAVYFGAAVLGRPSVLASFMGILFIACLLNGFTLLSIPYYYSDAITSLMLLIGLGVSSEGLAGRLRRSVSLPSRRTAEVRPAEARP